MDRYDDSGGAFPQSEDQSGGLTIRDYFAGQALTGLLASAGNGRQLTPQEAAIDAFDTADAMLAQRNK